VSLSDQKPDLTSIYNLDIKHAPDAGGHFGRFGGRFAAETLMQPLQ